MLRLLSSSDLWTWIQAQARKSTHKLAAIAYVTRDDLVCFGEGDTLLVDASDGAIGSRQTSAAVLRAAFSRGAKVGSLQGLHAKVLCLDHHVVVGSANMSKSSLEDLVEAAVVSDDPLLLGSTVRFIRELQKQAVPVDERFLTRAETIPIEQTRKPGRANKHPRVPTPRTWLIGVTTLDESRYEHEADQVEKGMAKAAKGLATHSELSWIRFTGKSRFRQEAEEGDLVIQIWRSQKNAKRLHVYPAVLILRRQDESACTRFYLPETADAERRKLPWGEFSKLWRGVTDLALPGRKPTRLLSTALAERLVFSWRR